MRAISLATLWLGSYYLLAQYGVFLLPTSVARQMTLPTYLAVVQITSILLGVTGLLFATREHRELRLTFFPEINLHGALEPQRPIVRFALWALLLAPLTYFCAHSLGMHLAYDTLIEELATRGARAVQQQSGELGRSATQNTLWSIFPFAVLIAPLGEELLFRGGVYGALQSVFVPPPKAPPAEPKAAPDSIVIAGLTQTKGDNLSTRLVSWGRAGGAAALISALVFGLMHADMPGGMGIVRVVSATVLGVALGLVRFYSSGLLAPLALHAGYNFLALATMRRWIVFPNWPTALGVPTLLQPVAAIFTGVVLAHFLVRRRATRQSGIY